ncbi:MAG TPA: hypothetical protein VF456_07725 [Vicinamibacterales bacterium]
MKKKRHYDLREFWPWYERSWPTSLRTGNLPPFRLNDLHEEEPLPTWARRILQILWLTIVPTLVGLTLWRFFLVR